MADVNSPRGERSKEQLMSAPADEAASAISFEVIELLFFAYRDFISDPDTILSEYGFGRAHHRVLHFVNRNPGMTVTELLDLLKITKQSLGRVLKQLVDTGFIEQRTGPLDRRQRLLSVTPAGHALAMRLAAAIGPYSSGIETAAGREQRYRASIPAAHARRIQPPGGEAAHHQTVKRSTDPT